MPGGRRLSAWLRTFILVGAAGRLGLGIQNPDRRLTGQPESLTRPAACSCGGVLKLKTRDDESYLHCQKCGRRRDVTRP